MLKNELRVEESEKAHASTKTELEAAKCRVQKAELAESKTSIASSDTEDLPSPAVGNVDRMRVPGLFLSGSLDLTIDFITTQYKDAVLDVTHDACLSYGGAVHLHES